MAPTSAIIRLRATKKLLLEDTTSSDKVQSIRTLVSGINPKLDAHLKVISVLVADVEKISSGELIDLTVSHLPNKSAKDKKRKRLILLLLKQWKQLEAEIDRVSLEVNTAKPASVKSFNLISKAQGIFGITTLCALVIVGYTFATKSKPQTLPPKVSAIIVQGKSVAVTQFVVGNGPDCSESHYHAPEEKTVIALDGSKLQDPGGCGFGKVSQTKIVSVPIPNP